MAKKESAEDKLVNIQAATLAAQVANWAAQLEFQKERMRLLEMPQFQNTTQLERDRFAFEKAQQEWQRAITEATMTGTYNGVPTLQWLEQQARLTGVINGQQTLEGKLTDAQIAQMNHSMELENRRFLLEQDEFGFNKDKWQQEFDYQKSSDLRKFLLDEANVTGTYNGQATLEKQQMDNQNAQAYLTLLSNLQGPGNAFKQLRVLGNTPGGLTDLVNAWTGRYQMGGLTGSGQAPGQAQVSDLYTQYGTDGLPIQQSGANLQGVSLPTRGSGLLPGQTPADGMWQGQEDVYTTMPAGEGAVGAEAGYTISPPGTQAPIQAYNYQGTPSGQTQVYPPGVPAPANQAQVSTQVPLSPGQAGARGREALAAQSPGLMPSQINAENYGNTNKYAQELMWAKFENDGWDPMAAKDAFAKSLPRYGGPKRGVVNAGLGM